ncbi:hypothetical protein RRG08_014887 [Elysia crispata]|uniref:Secreted protein n=1 Tax=Elysia crispata TaxID=231223 RepID=A0AAE1DIA2_9GAST|nr:hypothetical protein RRG08_014887 [Elysia crispata]
MRREICLVFVLFELKALSVAQFPDKLLGAVLFRAHQANILSAGSRIYSIELEGYVEIQNHNYTQPHGEHENCS